LWHNNNNITVTLAFAWAALLRFLTPSSVISNNNTDNSSSNNTPKSKVYRGWLQGGTAASSKQSPVTTAEATSGDDPVTTTVEYADGLWYNLAEGWYEFRCDCPIVVPAVSDHDNPEPPTHPEPKSVSEWLAAAVGSSLSPIDPSVFVPIIRAYLLAETGGNLGTSAPRVQALARAIARLYARMVAGDDDDEPLSDLLQEMKDSRGCYTNGFQTDCAVLL
jgi:hypothetical protein